MLEHWVVEVQSETPDDRHHSIGIRVDKSGQRSSGSPDSGGELIQASVGVPMRVGDVTGVDRSTEDSTGAVVMQVAKATPSMALHPPPLSRSEHREEASTCSDWPQNISEESGRSRSKFRAAHMHYKPEESRSREVGLLYVLWAIQVRTH
jgi:hypothetical protein